MSESTGPSAGTPHTLAELETAGPWETVFEGAAREALEAALPRYVTPRRWFGSKARTLRDIRIVEAIPVLPAAYLTLLRAEFAEGDPETYVLPIAFLPGPEGEILRQDRPAAAIAMLSAAGERGLLFDAAWDPGFCSALLEAIREGRQYLASGGDLVASATKALARLAGDAGEPLIPALVGVEQGNTSVRYGDRLILKLYRRLEAGTNPDQEIGQFLTERAAFANIPPLAGVLEFRRREPEGVQPVTIALLQGFVPNHGDAWRYSLDTLADYFAAALAGDAGAADDLALPQATLLELVRADIPARAEQLVGSYMTSARLLARRTGELHLALGSDPADPTFRPEPFTADFQGYLHRSMRDLADRIIMTLRARFDALPEGSRSEAHRVLALEGEIAARFDALLARPIHALGCRIHGDYHLGQVLYTGDDFMIIDFEGEPARPLGERKLKRSPLQDVAGMLRSFHYAAYAAYFAQEQDGEPPPALEPWARFWYFWVSAAYLKTYLETVRGAAFLPPEQDELKLLLDVHLLEKAVYELGYELNNRPGWVKIPLEGILQTMEAR